MTSDREFSIGYGREFRPPGIGALIMPTMTDEQAAELRARFASPDPQWCARTAVLGIPVIESPFAVADPVEQAAADGVRIVRHGLADVIAWCLPDEDLGPEPGTPVGKAYLVGWGVATQTHRSRRGLVHSGPESLCVSMDCGPQEFTYTFGKPASEEFWPITPIAD